MNATSQRSVAPMDFGDPVQVSCLSAEPHVLVVCEHASRHIPEGLNQLGLSDDAARSHIAWDPGALGVAEGMAQSLGSILVSGTISRLVYDCNRPPEATSAIPKRSEVFDIPGNCALDAKARAQRVKAVYAPFRDALAGQISQHRQTLKMMVTVHSFTPVFHGTPRDVQIGLLHGRDPRIANCMMAMMPAGHSYAVRMNEPYDASDGVAHTLDLHGAENDLPSVMIEIRNDLIEKPQQQADMAHFLSGWLTQCIKSKGRI